MDPNDLEARAQAHYNAGEFEKSLSVLNSAKDSNSRATDTSSSQHDSEDLSLTHNAALASYAASGCRDPQQLASALEHVKTKLRARTAAGTNTGALSPSISDRAKWLNRTGGLHSTVR